MKHTISFYKNCRHKLTRDVFRLLIERTNNPVVVNAIGTMLVCASSFDLDSDDNDDADSQKQA